MLTSWLNTTCITCVPSGIRDRMSGMTLLTCDSRLQRSPFITGVCMLEETSMTNTTRSVGRVGPRAVAHRHAAVVADLREI